VVRRDSGHASRETRTKKHVEIWTEDFAAAAKYLEVTVHRGRTARKSSRVY
jgi:hypothetical protein